MLSKFTRATSNVANYQIALRRLRCPLWDINGTRKMNTNNRSQFAVGSSLNTSNHENGVKDNSYNNKGHSTLCDGRPFNNPNSAQPRQELTDRVITPPKSSLKLKSTSMPPYMVQSCSESSTNEGGYRSDYKQHFYHSSSDVNVNSNANVSGNSSVNSNANENGVKRVSRVLLRPSRGFSTITTSSSGMSTGTNTLSTAASSAALGTNTTLTNLSNQLASASVASAEAISVTTNVQSGSKPTSFASTGSGSESDSVSQSVSASKLSSASNSSSSLTRPSSQSTSTSSTTSSPSSSYSSFSSSGSPTLPNSSSSNGEYVQRRAYDVPAYVGQGSAITSQLRQFASREIATIDLRALIEDGLHVDGPALIRNAQFLCRELPVRLAKRVVELDSLPYGLTNTPPVKEVRQWYIDSFMDIISFPPPTTEAQELEFTRMLENILRRHSSVVPKLAKGVLMIKENLLASNDDGFDCPFLTSFLDRFYLSRIGIRFLISQHCALHHAPEGFSGVVALKMDPVETAELAIDSARRLCERSLGLCPDVNIIVEPPLAGDNSLAYIPSHLHHMLFELLKNSMRAVVETHGATRRYDLPEIDIIFVSGQNDFSIKISDQGGGIPRRHMDRIWTYLHTTATPDVQKALLDDENLSGNGLTEAPLAGFGYGLPLSRLFARYFGGDLNVISMHGYGTDAILYLRKLVTTQDPSSSSGLQ